MAAFSNDGKIAEHHIQEALKQMEKTSKSTWVRLYDSKSAGLGKGGNAIPPQPADYIVATTRGCYLLEVKSSIVATTLSDTSIRSLFKENQILGARLWFRAGQRAFCAFYSVKSQTFELWDMNQVVTAYLAPPRQRQLPGKPLQVSKPSGLLTALLTL